MKKFGKLALTVALLVIGTAAHAEGPYKEINADELVKMKAEVKDLVIVDSRTSEYFDGTIIEGAKVLSAADTNEETLSKIAKKDQPIVFYCSNVNCPASAKAAHKAAELGYTNLYKYPGGVDEWKKKGLPVTTQPKA